MSKGTILITGASSGLGEEMARQFADLGYDLALCARRTDRLDALKGEITAKHADRRVELKALDVNDDDAVFAVFKEFAAEFGALDRLIINAGIGKGAPLGTGWYDANKQTAMTNFVAALAQTEAAMGDLPGLGQRPPGDDLVHLRAPRDAQDDHDVRRHEGRRRRARRGPDQREREGQGHRRLDHLPRLHPLGDEREGRPEDQVHGRHRDWRARDGGRDREAQAEGLRPRLAVGAARLRAQERADLRRPEAVLR